MSYRQPTDQLQENILALENADAMGTDIWFYSKSHQTLGLRTGHTYKDAETINIEFTGVEYFSGLTTWTGANIHLHSNIESLAFIEQNLPRIWQQYRELEKMGVSHIFSYKLYSIPTKEGYLIKIIAANVYIRSDEIGLTKS